MRTRFSSVLDVLSIAFDGYSMSFPHTDVEKASALSHPRIRDYLERDAQMYKVQPGGLDSRMRGSDGLLAGKTPELKRYWSCTVSSRRCVSKG